MLESIMLKQFVILVKRLKAINYLIQFPRVFLPNRCNLSFLMFGVLLQVLLVGILTMLSSLMTKASILGSIYLKKDPRFFKCFKTSKLTLNESLIAKSLLFYPMGRGIRKIKLVFPNSWHLSPSFLSSYSSAEWICRKKT